MSGVQWNPDSLARVLESMTSAEIAAGFAIAGLQEPEPGTTGTVLNALADLLDELGEALEFPPDVPRAVRAWSRLVSIVESLL